jgi:hypothetical protein
MWTVAIPLSARTLSGDHLIAMRSWLDQHRYEPSRFIYQLVERRPVVYIDFKIEDEAAEFAVAFRGEVLMDRKPAAVFAK